MLTRKQAELLKYICQSMSSDGIAPSFEEMKEAVGLKSKSGIHRLISGLEERGFIRRLPHRARALEILKTVDGITTGVPSAEVSVPAPLPDTIKEARPAANHGPANQNVPAVEIPMMGKIAAGTPIEAIRQADSFVSVPEGLLAAKADRVYALEVAGDSMIEAGILDGDTVLIERCENAENGVIVVALVEGEEVTLKRLRRRGDAIALEPANRDYETQLFSAGQVQIQGRLIGLMRQY
jgi:repressor LexA